MEFQKNILVTGGAGFIGSHVVRRFVSRYPQYQIINLDALTYAGNLENLKDVEQSANYRFVKGDITDSEFIDALFQKHKFDGVIHLAAESHVDRSITDPGQFIKTNILGTVNLLNAALRIWGENATDKRFYHISTDEVYGSLENMDQLFTEQTPYNPQSPYSASKAASDHFVRAWANTYKLPVIISNCSNNYGPFQFPEKLIPLIINNIKNNKPLPVYGQGNNIRDWLHVEDHAAAIDLLFHKGENGETYNIGSKNEWRNIDLVKSICHICDGVLQRKAGTSEMLITFVKDRKGHDLRYAIDNHKIETELGWKPSISFEAGLRDTVLWYFQNTVWLEHVTSGSYQQYYSNQYK
jgi:dTDP-glucose 4,6-dehydratase